MSETTRQVPPWVLPGGLAVLVIGLVSIALLRGQVSLDPDTPEGTVQEYLVAISEERWDEAIEIVHDDSRGGCDGRHIASFAPGEFSAELGFDDGFGGRVTRETFVAIPSNGGEDTTTVPESATEVEITIRRDTGAGLGSGWSEQVVFELIEDDGFWWLTGDPWPYFVWSCRG